MSNSQKLETFLNHILVERGLSKNTIESYRRDLQSVSAALDSINLNFENAKFSDLENLLSDLRRDAYTDIPS